MVAAIRSALSTRANLLLEILALRHQTFPTIRPPRCHAVRHRGGVSFAPCRGAELEDAQGFRRARGDRELSARAVRAARSRHRGRRSASPRRDMPSIDVSARMSSASCRVPRFGHWAGLATRDPRDKKYFTQARSGRCRMRPIKRVKSETSAEAGCGQSPGGSQSLSPTAKRFSPSAAMLTDGPNPRQPGRCIKSTRRSERDSGPGNAQQDCFFHLEPRRRCPA
jgi:hypothetical protein